MSKTRTITPNPPADFTPEMGNYMTLQPFRYWCQKVLPLVYDDSLSYYELLCKVVDYLNKTMEDVETLHGDVSNLHTAYEQLQSYVNNYFSTLDIQEEINNKLDEMSKDGTLSNIIRPLILQTLPPYVVNSVTEMTDHNRTYILKSNGHIYQYNATSGWFDTGLTYGESIGNVLEWIGVISGNVDFNDIAVQTVGILGPTDNPNKPVNNSGYIMTYGTQEYNIMQTFVNQDNGDAYYRFKIGGDWGEWVDVIKDWCEWIGVITNDTDFNNLSVQTLGIVGFGEKPNAPTKTTGYIFTFGSGIGNIIQMFFEQDTHDMYTRFRIGDNWGAWVNSDNGKVEWIGVISGDVDFNDIAVQTVGILGPTDNPNKPVNDSGYVMTYGTQEYNIMQTFVNQNNGDVYYRFKIGGVWGAWVKNSNNGKVEWIGLISSSVDFNDIAVQTVGILGPTDNANKPVHDSGYVMTYGTQGYNTMQTFVNQNNGNTYTRFRVGQENWSDWIKVYPEATTANTYAHMYSIGNSILTGSVWLDGAYDHLSAYGNAPYSVIANSLQIPKDNVLHKLISSTGLLYDAGQGNFLTNIKQVDLKTYDCLLTHLWVADMDSTFPLGSESSVAGDGSIAGAVMELINYMKTSNSLCQLILVSVPPVSTTIYGDNVFTGAYPNGSSLNELNTLMDTLAEKYHFTFLKWNDLNLSYYFHDYSDGLNVHANNENTYRVMGAYLGGRASAKLNF